MERTNGFVRTVVVSTALVVAVLLFAPTLREWTLAVVPVPQEAASDNKNTASEIARQKKRIAALKQRFASMVPNRPYLAFT